MILLLLRTVYLLPVEAILYAQCTATAYHAVCTAPVYHATCTAPTYFAHPTID